jgi:S1-C subfamily serine protease
MPKKSLLKIFLLTPLAGLLLAGSAFLIADYPQSVASITSANIFGSEDLNKKTRSSSLTQVDSSTSFNEDNLRKLIAEELTSQLLASRPAVLSSSTALHMLGTTVKIDRDDGGCGSGVPIFENQVGDQYYTYIITNAHVVRDNTEVRVSKFRYLNNATIEATIVYPGRVINVEPTIDLALIELHTTESIGQMANFISNDLTQRLALTQHIFVASCPLGSPPLLTGGRVASIRDTLTTITAFSIFGSSGSGAYDINGNLVGIVRSIVRVRLNEEGDAIPEPNITHIIPLPVVVSWLIVGGHGFIVNEGTHEDFILSRTLSQIRPNKKSRKP